MYSLFVKELRAFMSSKLALATALGFQLLSVWFLWVSPYTNTIVSAGVADWYPFLAWIPVPLLLVCAILSLHAFAEERQQGTFETLFSLPIAPVQIILAKYYAGILCLLFVLLPSLFQLILMAYLSVPGVSPDFGVFVISFLGIFLCGSSFIAMGMLASLYAKNIWISFMLGLLFMGFFAQALVGNWGVNAHLLSFNRGVLSLDDIFYFLNIIVISLVLITFKLKPKVVK
jgi:ABC-2 type transport system permease protein